MAMINSNTQRGRNCIYECPCGSHMIRIVKDGHDSAFHSFEMWEYRGDSNRTFWNRIAIAFNVIFKRVHKFPCYEVLVPDEYVEDLAQAILDLKNYDKAGNKLIGE